MNLTRHQVENFPRGELLDEEVGHALGWRWQGKIGERKCWFDPAAEMSVPGYFEPSCDMGAAWRVVEHTGMLDGLNLTQLLHGEYALTRQVEDDLEVVMRAETAPLLICRYFLLTKLWEQLAEKGAG